MLAIQRDIMEARENSMTALVFWIDVDNTLLDNDSVKANQDRDMEVIIGPKLTARYWELYEQVRKERDVVDIPLALRRLREETPLREMDEYTYRHLSSL